jgi:hypothetical protein
MKNSQQKLPASKSSTALYKKSLRLLFLITAIIVIAGCRKQATEKPEELLPSGKTKNSGMSVSTVGANIWFDKFVSYETTNGSSLYTSADAATLGWGESYMLRSYVVLYELTKDTAWLDKLTTHADEIISNATDLGSDGYLDWGTVNYGDGGNYPYLVFDGLISLPIAQFIRLVHQNPTTLSAYATKASTYRTFIENEIVPKWEDSGSYVGNCWVQLSTSTGYFKEPSGINTLPGGAFTPLPYNMMGPFAQMLWTMYDVNANTAYRDRGNHIVQYFKNGLTVNGTGYEWWYCNITSPHIEDTSHGNLDVDMAIDSYNRGGTITGTHIAGLSNTLTDYMWNQSLTAPKVKDKVDGTGTTYSDTRLLTGWTRMTQFNAKAWTIAAEQFRSYTPTTFNYAHTLAQIMAWDPVKVQNQGFELKFFSDATLPARWTRSGGTSSNIRLTTAEKYSGAMSAEVTSAAGDGSWQMLYQDWKEWKTSTTYEVSFNVKTNGSAGARVFMYNPTTSTVLGTVHTYDSPGWSTQSFTFTTPSTTGATFRIYLENRDLSNAGSAFFDNVKIKISGEPW